MHLPDFDAVCDQEITSRKLYTNMFLIDGGEVISVARVLRDGLLVMALPEISAGCGWGTAQILDRSPGEVVFFAYFLHFRYLS